MHLADSDTGGNMREADGRNTGAARGSRMISPEQNSSSSTSESSAPAIIGTTTDYSPNPKPPLALEKDTNSTASSYIPAFTVTVLENSQPSQLTSICPSVGPVESTVTATVHQASLPAAAIIIGRQVSGSSTEGNMPYSGNGGSGFRSSFNGRVPFARMLSSNPSSDRRSGNAGAEIYPISASSSIAS
ncbi:uncharacterized protein LOC129756954 [Uranotaenia lowii]|uniref:uncharacterized protein LOC129740149 n=2 Tax=Uranotaenia lowii TaxID=190385 RepID=UPI0024797D8E|nr:uncharacterized protein LOC129740149 [Uranotaenia lowii]XP_055593744.1 uncharacterized protein LOC129744956 [Uranotaenia lowii]XP_055595585.1 uncharacterized protein LOC129746122 [Uranotaenia lowii]XP_055600266.1 uncharacterized protein LOC129749347 [Uranotaenia lowii]XP_055603335.1 uncharacterized protein LOC129751696 [Uranotaenia lowii]XP_055610009.1 uncharacterized protein LOC129756954 [Uranotaenia lowii]